MPTRETLENIFAAYVNQDTLESAAEWMAANASSDSGYAQEVRDCLTEGANLSAVNKEAVLKAVNLSGYTASTPALAHELCADLLALFEQALKHEADRNHEP